MIHRGRSRMDLLRAEYCCSGRFESRQFCREIEAQLSGFLLGEPVGHLRKNRAVEQCTLGIPRHRLRRPCFGQYFVELLPNLVRIGPEYLCWRIVAEQVRLLLVQEQVALAGGCHVSQRSDAESLESCAKSPGDASPCLTYPRSPRTRTVWPGAGAERLGGFHS